MPEEPSYFLGAVKRNSKLEVPILLEGNISQEDLRLALLWTASKGHSAVLSILLKKKFPIEVLTNAKELAEQDRYSRSAQILEQKINEAETPKKPGSLAPRKRGIFSGCVGRPASQKPRESDPP